MPPDVFVMVGRCLRHAAILMTALVAAALFRCWLSMPSLSIRYCHTLSFSLTPYYYAAADAAYTPCRCRDTLRRFSFGFSYFSSLLFHAIRRCFSSPCLLPIIDYFSSLRLLSPLIIFDADADARGHYAAMMPPLRYFAIFLRRFRAFRCHAAMFFHADFRHIRLHYAIIFARYFITPLSPLCLLAISLFDAAAFRHAIAVY